MPLKVCPSIIAGDQARLGEEVRAITEAGADLVHLDVMDGHFVPNLTLGPGVVADLRRHSSLPFDCHLMLTEPWRYVEAFAAAGADRISVHVETPDCRATLERIRGLGRIPGIAINPDTPASAAFGMLDVADFAVVMTVHPGFYGQKMIVPALDKVRVLRDHAFTLGRFLAVQVDGGVSPAGIARIVAADATEVVAGAAVFKAPDYAAAIASLRGVGPGT